MQSRPGSEHCSGRRPNEVAAVGLEEVMEVTVAERVGFDEFVAPHLRAMWTLASRFAGADRREDVVQDALLVAWRRFETFDPTRGTARTWLLLLVMDRCRKLARVRPPALELVDVASPVREVEAHLDLDAAVRALPRRQRTAVELYYVLGLPVLEVAVVMGCAAGTVSSTLSDARRALRHRLEEERHG